jgi:hypothetical protein
VQADVDFWPSTQLLPLLRQQLPAWGAVDKALVVPNFQRSGHGCRNDPRIEACHEALAEGRLAMPDTFDALAACLGAKDCAVFDSEYNPTGQSSTDHGRWKKLPEGRTMRIGCFASERYEPYVVLRRGESTPTFDERFFGYGKNKVQLLVHLRLAGFAFEALGRGFLLHFPHQKSAAKELWLHNTGAVHGETDRLFRQFRAEIAAQYRNRTQLTPLCPRAASKDRT